MHHKLDLGLPEAQQYTTVKAATDIKVQDKEDTPKVHMSDDNGQNNQEIYRRAEYIIPQLDGTHNTSDSSNIDSHDLADIEIIKPNTRGRKLRQKVPDDEVIDIDKIAKDDTPRYTIKQELKDVLHARKLATEIKRKLKENRKQQAEKARQLQIEKDLKEKEAKRHALERLKYQLLLTNIDHVHRIHLMR